jgi:hypothetical protein
MQRATTTLALSGLALLGVWLVSPESEPLPPPVALSVPAHEPAPRQLPQAALPEPAWLDLSERPNPRRLQRRPSSCTNPPPGGTWQVATIDSARQAHCEEALDAWSGGMAMSEDHCVLARTVWTCFTEVHRRPLLDRSFRDFGELVPLLVHLEGEPERRAEYARELSEIGLPSWLWPAPSGLERRLDAFQWDRELQEAVLDLYGEGVLTDQLAADLLLEAEIAAALQRLPADQRTPYLEEVWARRVYVVVDALYGRPGELMQVHGRQMYDELRALVAQALVGAPEKVRRAHAVASREESAL